ncbi:MAG TPA: hypothetical protein PL045_13605, partial [Chitinophagaceae bacterium]|nr:hypothetical protein [Chitinophagaceae bacterium]
NVLVPGNSFSWHRSLRRTLVQLFFVASEVSDCPPFGGSHYAHRSVFMATFSGSSYLYSLSFNIA